MYVYGMQSGQGRSTYISYHSVFCLLEFLELSGWAYRRVVYMLYVPRKFGTLHARAVMKKERN